MRATRPKLAAGLALGAALGLGVAPLASSTAASPAHAVRAKARITYPARGAGFVGTSSQKSGTLALPVDLRASPNGRAMARFDIQWSTACQGVGGTGSFGGLSITVNKPIVAPGVFSDGRSFTRSVAGGGTGLFTTKLYGRFTSSSRAAGTFNVTITVTNATGATTNTCDSGTINWVATN